jgi:DNA-binding IclR family transcriptional regulator
MLLAHVSPERQREAIDAHAEHSSSQATTLAPEKLVDELGRIRARGFAIADQMHVAGQRCVAAPIRSRTNEVIGAVDVAAAKSAFSRAEVLERLAPLVVASAEQMSAHLGYTRG